jgi:hypothetical protein
MYQSPSRASKPAPAGFSRPLLEGSNNTARSARRTSVYTKKVVFRKPKSASNYSEPVTPEFAVISNI